MKDLEVSFPKPCDQPWDEMASEGCNRHCAACSKTIYDLEKLAFNEAEALLSSGDEVCVRAKVDRAGNVRLAKSPSRTDRRLKAALGATATLALAACSTFDGSAITPRFTVSGNVEHGYQRYASIELVGEGRTYETRPKLDRGFQFTNLRAGSYQLAARDNCGELVVLAELNLSEDDVDVGSVDWEENDDCIIIGVMIPASRSFRG